METASPSGAEQDAVAVWVEEAKKFADSVHIDQHGNAAAVINESGSPRVMLAGHIDEIGLMITHIDDNGFLSFTAIGGWDPQMLPGQRVRIITKNESVTGVIGKKPIHLMEKEERDKVVKTKNLWIDIGAQDKEVASKSVRIGDSAVLAHPFVELKNDLVLSRGFDNKSGAFVVLEAARLLAKKNPQAAVHAVATVQEEVGLRGARTSAYAIDPDIGIVVDVDHATDYPSMEQAKKESGDVKLGKGPTITRGPNINPRAFELLIKTAQDNSIPHQIVAYPRGTGTDANAIQLTKSGVVTLLVGIPNRYMHSPCEIVHLGDLETAAKLIAVFVEQLNTDLSFISE